MEEFTYNISDVQNDSDQIMTQNQSVSYKHSKFAAVKQMSQVDTNKNQISKQEESLLLSNDNKIKYCYDDLDKQNQQKRKYYDFFRNVIPDPQNYTLHKPSEEDFKKHNIKQLIGNEFEQKLQSYTAPFITVKYTQKESTIVVYTVIIAMFKLEIILLNIDDQAEAEKFNIGKGGFAYVRMQEIERKKFAVKRQRFKNKDNIQFKMMANKYQIEEAIIELAIYKICSLFKIGPAIETQIGFDLVCYNDCIEFHIQLCMKIYHKDFLYVDIKKFQIQMKQNLLILHMFQIIHKDIKPSNILYSKAYDRYVFIDFGISHPVKESIGEKTLTYRQGTYEYISDQMRNVKLNEKNYVDLYENDKHALSLVFQKKIVRYKYYQSLNELQQYKQIYYRTSYQYEYFKLKFYCIRHNKEMRDVEKYWKLMNNKRTEELVEIVAKSMDYHKIQVVGQFFKLSKFKYSEYLSQIISLYHRKHIQNIKQTQVSELKLKNIIRIYGYYQEAQDIIIQLKSEQKYSNILKKININIEKYGNMNSRHLMLGNNRFYIKRIHQQLEKAEGKQKFNMYMILLTICEDSEKYQIVSQLKQFKYKRSKAEYIEELIRVTHALKTKEKLNQFKKQMLSNKIIIQIVDKFDLYGFVANIYEFMDCNDQALYYYTKKLKFDILNFGQCHYNISSGYTNQANVYMKLKKYQKALENYNLALQIDLNLYGEEHPFIALNYHGLGKLHKKQKEYGESLQLYQKSLQISTKYYGENHLNNVKIYNSIGNMYQVLSKSEEAIKYYQKSMKILKNHYTVQNYLHGKIYNNLAISYFNNNDYGIAIQYYQKSIRIDKIYANQENIIQAKKYRDMGLIYQRLQKYKIALDFYLKSLTTNIKLNGEHHHDTIINISNILDIYAKNRHDYQILASFDQVFSNCYSIQYKNTVVATIFNFIGIIYVQISKYKNAYYYFIKSLNIHHQLGQSQINESLANIYYNIANTCKYLKQSPIALEYFEKCIQYYKYIGREQLHLACVYNDMGKIYLSLKKYTNAREYLEKILQILTNGSFKPPFFVKIIQYQMSKVYARQKKQRKTLCIVYKIVDIYLQQKVNQNRLLRKISTRLKVKRILPKNRSDQIIIKYIKRFPILINNNTLLLQYIEKTKENFNCLSRLDLIKILMRKKQAVKFEQLYKNNRYDYLFYKIEIFICYKQLNYQKQIAKQKKQIIEQLQKINKFGQQYLIMKVLSTIS